ncbi:response regulator [Bradyrhizobium sp. AUGA SZCCT0177]|uniref:response regulator n=1 Tax=Bradyrhizobium sp. AUGA SZCCT0177 TaxID=2807665 RepID=UPI001BA4FF05|nr:response regulator [Bradyrhizobium sp. AUGA SZCCT0177]MBR1282887.1 response regulator [Bradyrhizobium sp. AUGA SZCCT0177]
MIDARHTSGRSEIGPPPRKSLIYVVDDDYDVLRSLRFLLETEGFDVRTFRSGSALLGSSTRQAADCLVVDYKMAGIDGLELAHRLRGLDVSTPIILITGYPDETIATKANSAGVLQVLLKPNLEENLVECVQNAVNSGAATGQP